MKPLIHANLSASKFGGAPEDYQEIHNFLDLSKSCHADVRHRAMLHNSLGIFIAEMIFGVDKSMLDKLSKKYNWDEEQVADILMLLNSSRSGKTTHIVNSDNEKIPIRTIAEAHVLEDMGKIPALSDYLNGMPMYSWLGMTKNHVVKTIVE